jgi:hypothetical protein
VFGVQLEEFTMSHLEELVMVSFLVHNAQYYSKVSEANRRAK